MSSVWIFLHRAYVFRAQTQEIKERGGNQSTGIDFFITQERVIFLDTQVRMKYCGSMTVFFPFAVSVS